MPNNSSEAKGVSNLLKAYRLSSHLKEKARKERQRQRKGAGQIMTHKKKLKGMYDDEIVSQDFPSAMKFVSNGQAPQTPLPKG